MTSRKDKPPTDEIAARSSRWLAVTAGLLDHPIVGHQGDDPFCNLKAWLDLLRLAEWRPTVRSPSDLGRLPRGALAATNARLGARWGWSERKVGRFLAELRAADMVVWDDVGGRHPKVIRIVNYERYQPGSRRVGDRPSRWRATEKYCTPHDMRRVGAGFGAGLTQPGAVSGKNGATDCLGGEIRTDEPGANGADQPVSGEILPGSAPGSRARVIDSPNIPLPPHARARAEWGEIEAALVGLTPEQIVALRTLTGARRPDGDGPTVLRLMVQVLASVPAGLVESVVASVLRARTATVGDAHVRAAAAAVSAAARTASERPTAAWPIRATNDALWTIWRRAVASGTVPLTAAQWSLAVSDGGFLATTLRPGDDGAAYVGRLPASLVEGRTLPPATPAPRLRVVTGGAA